MTDFLAFITVILWPVIPLFWIPVHFASKFFKKLGLFTYVMPLLTWLPLVYFIYKNRNVLLHYKIDIPVVLNITGIIFVICGTFLHIWTARLLGFLGIIGLPEISTKVKGRLVTKGPFSIIRHPTYLAHTLMFLGIFLLTEVVVVGVITILDLIIITILLIPLEERELLSRFGEEYKLYKIEVPSKIFPWSSIKY